MTHPPLGVTSAQPVRLTSPRGGVPRSVVFLALLTLAGCNGHCFGMDAVDDEVKEVRIIPGTVYSGRGQLFALRARAFNAADAYLPVLPEAEIQWVLESPSELAGTVELYDPGTPQPKIWVTDDAPTGTHQVRLTVDGVTSPPATILISPDNSGATQADLLSLPHEDGSIPEAVLVSARIDGVCGYLSVAMAGNALIQEPLEGDCPLPSEPPPPLEHQPPPRPEVAVFSADYGSRFLDLGELGSDFGPGSDRLTLETLPQLDERTLDVNLYFFHKASVTEEEMQDGVLKVKAASALLAENRVGLKLNAIPRETGGGPLAVSDTQNFCLEPGERLKTLLEVAGMSSEDARGRVQEHVLHLILVEELGDPRGKACQPSQSPASSPGRFVLLDWVTEQSGIPTILTSSTIAHEVGHILSLAYPGLRDDGHSQWYASDFDRSNLMWADDFDVAALQDHFSLGQAWRMNFHPGSWAPNELDVEGSEVECQTWWHHDPPEPGSPEPRCVAVWTDVPVTEEGS